GFSTWTSILSPPTAPTRRTSITTSATCWPSSPRLRRFRHGPAGSLWSRRVHPASTRPSSAPSARQRLFWGSPLRSQPPTTCHLRPSVFLYAVTIFLGAFLLFQIQPIMGKYVLPWFGGAPAVWSTCLVFFQLVLLAGYLYAHGLATRLSP